MTKSPTINFFSPPSLSSQLSSCSRNLSNQRLFQRFWYSSSVTLSVIFLYFTWSLLLWFELWLISSNFSSTSFPWNLMLSCRSAMSFFKIYFLLSNCYIFFQSIDSTIETIQESNLVHFEDRFYLAGNSSSFWCHILKTYLDFEDRFYLAKNSSSFWCHILKTYLDFEKHVFLQSN